LSTLTIALACLGGVVLAGVVAHGAWQARKAGPRRADEPVPPARDKTSEPREFIEPVMGDGPAPALPADASPAVTVDATSRCRPWPSWRRAARPCASMR
jgi:hypothetical protein